MTKNKMLVLAGVLTLLLVGMAVAVKMIFFPSVSDEFFALNESKLKQAPANVVILRPTHFAKAKSARNGSMSTQVTRNGKSVQRLLGRNVSLPQVITAAYGVDMVHIVLPKDVPKGDLDYLVTVSDNPEAHLKTAIRKKLGLVGHTETRDMPVMALKVQDANSSGLKASPANEREGVGQKGNRLYFTHQKLSVVTDGLEGMLKMPVVDKTGLTGFYNFSLVWDAATQQAIQNGTLDAETGKKILADWGLGLEPDTAPMDMLVVEKK